DFVAGVAAAALAAPSTLHAAAPPAGRPGPAFYRFRPGDYKLTALYDGVWNRPIDKTFVRNAPFAAVQEALAAHFLPVDRIALPVNAMLVNTGSRLVLIDTGTAGQMDKAAGALLTNLAAAGVAP